MIVQERAAVAVATTRSAPVVRAEALCGAPSVPFCVRRVTTKSRRRPCSDRAKRPAHLLQVASNSAIVTDRKIYGVSRSAHLLVRSRDACSITCVEESARA